MNIEKWQVRADVERIQAEKEEKMKAIMQRAGSKRASKEEETKPVLASKNAITSPVASKELNDSHNSSKISNSR